MMRNATDTVPETMRRRTRYTKTQGAKTHFETLGVSDYAVAPSANWRV